MTEQFSTWAALRNVGMLRYVLGQEGAEVVINNRDTNGKRLLHLAVGSNFQTDKVRLLLRHSADMEVKDSHGNTPVHCAAYGGGGCVMSACGPS